MELLEDIQRVIEKLPEDRLREILDFARLVAQARDRDEWQVLGRQHFASAFGDDEPEYTEADIKKAAS